MGQFLTATALYVQMVDTSQDTATTALLADCVSDAEAEVLKRLSERYDVSSDYFTDPAKHPAQVKMLVKWLGIGYAYDALSRGGKEAMERAERYISRATKNLDAIVKGEANLVGVDGAELPSLTGVHDVYSSTSEYRDTFDEGDPLHWSVDGEKLLDIRNSKI